MPLENNLKNMKRREFLKYVGLSTGMLPFLSGLPSLAESVQSQSRPPQRFIFMFSPNGTIPDEFWPDETGSSFQLKQILQPLSPFKNRLMTVKGISNKIRGDGDGHMRGMSCMLTAKELFPGNIQGGSDTPAGWCSGISIDQEISNFFQSREATRTRFGNLTLGVAVPHRADPWTRWVYGGPNDPIAPIDDPYQLFGQLYNQMQDAQTTRSILDPLKEDLRKVARFVSAEDRDLLEAHARFIREMETEMESLSQQQLTHAVPDLEPGIVLENDSIPQVSRMQIDLLANAFANDMARVATLQYTNSVGNARMSWLGITEGHHALSHDPDLNTESKDKLTRINIWFAEQLAMLAARLDSIPEPGHDGSLLDHTTIIWTNELGKGNSHTLNNIPFVFVGNGLGFKTGCAFQFDNVAHNRLWMSCAHAVGHNISSFGNPEHSSQGPLNLTTPA